MSLGIQNRGSLWQSVEAYTPAPEQPLWRRLLYVTLATSIFTMLLPNAIVVSDVSHNMLGFEPFPQAHRQQQPVENSGSIWLAEERDNQEWYSNGLMIDNKYRIQNERRFFQMLDRSRNLAPTEEWLSEPIGIVFHATESPQAPFDPEQNSTLQRLGKSLLGHIRDNRSYNFVVDRFGRVFRVVDESDAAHHAGNSLWADGRWAFVNLNASFLGVAFEAQGKSLTTAQVHAGRLLTQFLRTKFRIAPELCVTHAQVSVNPSNMRIGYHTDWAGGFPFAEMGLPNNYDLPLASITDFGFNYDEAFVAAVGHKMWRGLRQAENQLDADAKSKGDDPNSYKSALQDRYRRLYASLKVTGALDEGVKLH
ncbi:MAG TPA: peptidoglycan recognition family protein [Bryobacteraceae bacterium]|nr:peptidoglycan recognition family protein [Bryobacteraceae bacterium]